MKTRIIETMCIGFVMGTSMAVFPHATGRPAPSATSSADETQNQPGATAPAGGSVTLAGCVQREADYRRAHDAGRGGAAGTGAGVGNEFILVSTSTTTAGVTPPQASTPGAQPAEPGIAVETGDMAGKAYELTGPGEAQLKEYVGRRVEIVGKMKSPPTPKSGRAPAVILTVPESTTGRPGTPGTVTGSPSGRPARPASGVEITGHDLHLGELEVLSVRAATGSCPSGQP
jgi:hypothetical protein